MLRTFITRLDRPIQPIACPMAGASIMFSTNVITLLAANTALAFIALNMAWRGNMSLRTSAAVAGLAIKFWILCSTKFS